MARVSEELIRNLFAEYCQLLGKKVAKHFSDVGSFSLDHDSQLGGYRINEITSKNGTTKQPFGDNRHKPGDFETLLRFGIKTLETKKR
jgi:hypothetical protein